MLDGDTGQDQVGILSEFESSRQKDWEIDNRGKECTDMFMDLCGTPLTFAWPVAGESIFCRKSTLSLPCGVGIGFDAMVL